MSNIIKSPIIIFIKDIPKWWVSFKSNPTTPIIEKVNILFIGMLALVTTVLAGLTFSQQQEIKGMSNLLYKQDTLIHDQGLLIKYTINLNSQNKLMIAKLDTSNIYFLQQIKAISNQTKSYKYTTKPQIGLEGNVQIQKLESKDNYRFVIGVRNNGNRSAINLNMKAFWVEIKNDHVTEKIIYNNFTPDAEFLSNQSKTYMGAPFEVSEINRKEMETYFLAMQFDFIDPLTRKSEKIEIFGRPLKLSDEQIFYYMATGKNLELLKEYLHNRHNTSPSILL